MKNTFNLSFIFFLAVLFIVFVVSDFYLFSHIRNIFIAKIIIQIVFLLIPSIILIKIYKLDLKTELYFQLPRAKQIFFTILLYFVVYLTIFTLGKLVNLFSQDYQEYLSKSYEIYHFKISKWYLVILSTVLTPAILEELFFRGVVLNILDRDKKGASILLSSFFFAMFHLEANPIIFTELFAIGLFLCLIYIQTKSIYISMFFHFLINLGTIISINYL